MVGAVIVKAGKIIAEGHHHYCGGDHAEVDALKKAGSKARGTTLYVTLEPCNHFGRTPPCTQAIIKSGIKKVVVGALDPNKVNNGQSLKFLRKQGIEVEQGLLAEELTRMNEAFNCWVTRGRPFVTAKVAQTIDGKIATQQGESQWITSETARDYAHRLRFGFDAILVGINTVLKDDPRLITVPLKPIKKIILDTRGRMPKQARLWKSAKPGNVLVFTAKNAPLEHGRIDLKWVLECLGKQGATSLLIEGGGGVVGHALERGLVDKMMIYTAPKIMGEGIPSVRGVRPKALKDIIRLKDMTIDKIGEDILIQGYPEKAASGKVIKW
jgi:diaminohydroxyphosphoribosylaminopyrimidine deaminase/5-amino-6-(5-phosphoribosylamino)uracil reductase